MKLKYDPKADRIRLVLDREGQDRRIYWLRRNQCLVLLVRLSDVAVQLGIETRAVEPLRQPPPSPRGDPSIDAAEPVHLDGIRVRVDGEKMRLVFVEGDGGIGLSLKAPGIQRLQEVLTMQAERAGWDPVAGITRLRAMADARAAISRSRNGND